MPAELSTTGISRSNHPVHNQLKTNQAFRPNPLHFKGNDSITPLTSLPEWTKQVQDPSITMPLLSDELNNFIEEVGKLRPLGFFSKIGQGAKLAFQGAKLAFRGRTLRHEIASENSKYLPKEAQQDLSRYHRTLGYWWNRLFNPQQAKLMDVVYQGPLIIKAKQQEVSNLLPLFQQGLKNLTDEQADNNTQERLLNKVVRKLAIWWTKRQISNLECYAPLLNKVPALPYAQFETQLNGLKAEYNQKYADDPIAAIQPDPIGTGSMGQVYKATTKSGKNLVLKVIRPNLTDAYQDGFLPYTYYKTLLITGCTPQAKHQAAYNAQTTVDILKSETRLEEEAANTRQMGDQANKIEARSFEIPKVLVASKTGLILPFVGEKDLADVSPEEQAAVKVKLAPDIARFLLLSAAKPLDLHNGNMRIGQPAAWIDHGRQINIPEENHQKLLRLMVSAFKAPDTHPNLPIWDSLRIWDRALLQADTRNALRELLELNPEENRQALENLNQLEKLTNLDELVTQRKSGISGDERAEINKKLKPFTATKIVLSQILGEPNIRTTPGSGLSVRTPASEYSAPSVLNAWATCAMNLPGFANAGLPPSDVAQYKQKTHGFLVPYLQQAKTLEEFDQQLTELAGILAGALEEQTGDNLNDVEYQQLINTMKEALRNDLPVQEPSSRTS
jgi:hypothetical protein